MWPWGNLDPSVVVMDGDGKRLVDSVCASELARMLEMNLEERRREMEQSKGGFQVGVRVSALVEGL